MTLPPQQNQEDTQKLLEEAFEGVGRPELSPEEVNRLAAEWEERHTEGHVPREPFRTNPHD